MLGLHKSIEKASVLVERISDARKPFYVSSYALSYKKRDGQEKLRF